MSEFDHIKATSESLKTLHFRKAGIFSNALVNNTDITSLIRDADQQEAKLYTTSEGKPQRKDGTKGVADIEQTLDMSDSVPLVQVPVADQPEQSVAPDYLHGASLSSDSRDIFKYLQTRKGNTSLDDYDMDALFMAVDELVAEFPLVVGKEFMERVYGLKSKYAKLSEEMDELNTVLKHQRRELGIDDDA